MVFTKLKTESLCALDTAGAISVAQRHTKIDIDFSCNNCIC